jgi:hypothetical protein
MAKYDVRGDMTTTTQTIRDQGVMVVESDIPAELTLRQYRVSRAASGVRPRRKRFRLRRRASR